MLFSIIKRPGSSDIYDDDSFAGPVSAGPVVRGDRQEPALRLVEATVL